MRSGVEFIDEELIESVRGESRRSERQRANHNFHEPGDYVQRMLSVMQPGTYVQPHKHENPDKVESFIILRGEAAFIWFDDEGKVLGVRRISERRTARGVDILPGVWHTLVALDRDTVIFEAKEGPYTAETDKKWAPWAPGESEEGAGKYLASLVGIIERGQSGITKGEGRGG